MFLNPSRGVNFWTKSSCGTIGVGISLRVSGEEYGPADLETLREWKREGRLLPTNEARSADAEVDLWTTAADIPGLFESDDIAAVPAAGRSPWRAPLRTRRSFAQILVETVRIYRKGFFQFVGLTLLTLLPSVFSQLTGALIGTTPDVNVDLRTLAAGAFGF